MIPKQIETLLRKSKFIPIATSTLSGRPNVVPKFLIDINENYIYLVDYASNLTSRNFNKNPFVAISVSDEESLTAYQLKGKARVLSKGREYGRMNKILQQKIEQMSIDRVVAAVRSGRKSESYELSISAKIVIFKVKVKEIFIISPTGTVTNEKLGNITVVGDNPIIKTELATTTIPLLYPPMMEKQLP